MNLVDSINDKSSKTYFDNIDRIVNAERITKIEEMKQLVKFIDNLIQNIIYQINNGLLSEKGARIKILQLFSIIQHCMIDNHPAIKPQITRLLATFEQKFKQSIYSQKLEFKPRLIVLEAKKIEHYVDSILDKQSDPIYSEQPLTNKREPLSEAMNTIDIELVNKKAKKELIIRNYFISTISMKLDKKYNQNEFEINENRKKKNRIKLFAEIKASIPKNVNTTR